MENNNTMLTYVEIKRKQIIIKLLVYVYLADVKTNNFLHEGLTRTQTTPKMRQTRRAKQTVGGEVVVVPSAKMGHKTRLYNELRLKYLLTNG